jgi:hypothetical protein
MTNQAQARYMTLICEGDRWHAKGMYEVADIYYRAAAELEATFSPEE